MSAPKFYIGDKVRRINKDHLGMRVGQLAMVVGMVGPENYQLSTNKAGGSHKAYNLELVSAGDLRIKREILANAYGANHPHLTGMAKRMRIDVGLQTLPFHPDTRSITVNTNEFDFYAAPTPNFAKIPGSVKARNVEEAKADLAKAEAALAAETALNEFKDEVNSKIRLAGAIVQALSDMRDIATEARYDFIARKDYAEFKSELCATLKEYGYKVVFIGDKSKAIVAKV